MNTKSLNRSIGLAMSALQQARAYQHGATNQTIMFLKRAIRWLNKARARLKQGHSLAAHIYASGAHEQIKLAIATR
jgi:hypothetical protein